MTKEGKVSRLLATFNTLSEGDQNLVIKFSESIIEEDGNMTNIISNSGKDCPGSGWGAKFPMGGRVMSFFFSKE
jgi:hypothetical protein